MMKGRWQPFGLDESGGVGVIGAAGLVMLLAMAALVVDLGHLYVVRSDLRKAAEAGASAGSRALRDNTTGVKWDTGWQTAINVIRLNYADNTQLSSFSSSRAPNFDSSGNSSSQSGVQTGYWDTRWTRATAPANLLGYTDASSFTPDAQQIPAVKVQISKAAGGTGINAPVPTYFASVLGIDTMDAQGVSVATIIPSYPGTVPPGACFPLATPETFLVNYLASGASFRIGPSYLNPDGGDWTSFLIDSNAVPTIRDLIDNGNPSPLHVGDQIWIQPGVRDTLYGYAETMIGEIVLLPVVPNHSETHEWAEVLGFAAFQIEDAHQGSNPYIQGHFVKDFVVSSGAPGGPNYGAQIIQSRMVQ